MPMKPSRIVSSSSSPNAPYLSYHPRQKGNGTSWHVLAHEFQIAVAGALGIAAEALFLRGLALQSAFAVIPGTTIGFGHRSRKGNALGRARLVPLVPTAQGQQRQERGNSARKALSDIPVLDMNSVK
jgi:hypothetical protein